MNVSLLDQELRSSIRDGLKTIEKACLKSRPSNLETEVRVPVNDPLVSSVNAQSDCSNPGRFARGSFRRVVSP